MAQHDEEVVFVAPETLREMFNTSQYPALIRQRRLTMRLLQDDRPSSAKSKEVNEPRGTRSQIVGYFDDTHRLVLVAHRYQRPDRSIGGSGQPDPKSMWQQEKIWRVGFNARDSEEPT